MTSRTTSLRWLIGSTLLAASVAQASDTPVANNEPAAAPLENGVRAYVDPATGKLRQPTPAERAEEARQAAAAKRAGKGRAPTITRRADGTLVATDNDGRFMESMVATRNADGSVRYDYVQGEVEAVPVAAPAPQLEEK